MPNPLRKRTHLIGLAAAVLLVVATAWVAWPRPIALPAVPVVRGEVRSTVVDLGETRVREPYAITAPASGQLRRIVLEPGDAVAAGDVVARIDPAHSTPLDARTRGALDAALGQAQAVRQRARSAATLAADEARRTADLWARGLVAEQVHLAAQSHSASAQASLREAEAGVARAQAELSDRGDGGPSVAVRAPAGGTVLVRYIESARPVVAGESLLEIGDLDALEVVAEFLSQDAALIRAGARAWIEGWGGEPVPARVRKVSPSGRRKPSALGVEEQRVDVWLDPEAPLAGVGHGFQVEARIEVAHAESALRVPVESLVRSGDRWLVWRISAGRLESVVVTPGISDGVWRVIDHGLAEGDLLVHRPPAELRAGMRASPLGPAGATGEPAPALALAGARPSRVEAEH